VSNRIKRRARVFTKVFPNGQICKVWFSPFLRVGNTFIWNVSTAIGRSVRQLNDWSLKRKNKRAKRLKSSMSGRVGSASLFFVIRILRQCYRLLPPGDSIAFKCESVCSSKQYKVWEKWLLNKEADPWQALPDVKSFFINQPLKYERKDLYSEVCELDLRGTL